MNDNGTLAVEARPFARRACRARWALPAPCPAPCRVKPTSLMASIGKTQSIRFRIRPPSSAPNNAAKRAGDRGPWPGHLELGTVARALGALPDSAFGALLDQHHGQRRGAAAALGRYRD